LSIYKSHEIRGHVYTEITPEMYRAWGRALGAELPVQTKFVVGGDVRLSTPELLPRLVEGLCQSGLDVVDLGCLPTPMIDYARRRLAAGGWAMVTASDGPPDFNGLRWMLGDRPPTEEDVDRLRREAEKPPGKKARRTPTGPRTVDVTFDYVAWLQERWVEARAAPLHVVLDPMHGCWANRARRYLHAVFPGLVISTIHDEPDPVFGGHTPDCARHERLEDLTRAIDHQRADLGIAFDGDGDRVVFAGEVGNVLTAEEATWVLLQSFGPALRGKPFVYDQRFSDQIPAAAAKLGAEPLVERSAHPCLRARMVDCGAPFGADATGHYFFGELAGADDGLFGACQMIAHLAQSGQTLSEWRRQCPPVCATPDLCLPAEAADADAAIEQVRAAWAKYPQRTLDGVRVEFPDGWALIRRSAIEPLLACRFEAADLETLDKLVHRFSEKLPGLGDDIWDRYEEAMHPAG